MKVFLILVLLYFAGVNSQDVGSDGSCFVPVTCPGSGGQHHTTVEWRELTTSKCEECAAPCSTTSTTPETTGFDELVAKVNQLQDLLTWYKASNGYYYKVFAERVNYATAKAKCVEYGGILASRGPRDTHVRGDLVNLMKQDDPDHTWIGANDILNEGTWVWEDGVVSTAMDWSRGQPDNSGNEDCAQYNHPPFGWKVNDRKCNIRMKFLCEKKYNVA